jgi:Sulfotransferase family
LRAHRFWHQLQDKPRVHFLHLGKTGGSAVKYAIESSANPHVRYVVYLHPHETTLRNVPEQQKYFFFLRDPISRFISGFYSRQRQGRPRYFMAWTPDEKVAFEHFGSPNELAGALSSDDPQQKTNAEAAMRSILHVKDPYWSWFESEDYFASRLPDLFFVGFQEQLSSDFEILKAKLELEDIALPQDEVHAHRNPADLDKSLDERAVTNLKNWYAADFRFVDLCRKLVREREELRTGT